MSRQPQTYRQQFGPTYANSAFTMNDTLSGKRRLQLLLSLRSSSEIVLETSTGSILAAVGLYGSVLVLIVVYKTPRL